MNQLKARTLPPEIREIRCYLYLIERLLQEPNISKDKVMREVINIVSKLDKLEDEYI